MTPESIKKEAMTSMDKAIDYLKSELKGIRTGRASTALVDFVKVDYYGNPTDLKALAAITVPDATHIIVQPFDPSSLGEIRKAIESADLGLNPQADGKILRIAIPPLSTERRQQLCGQVKKMGEEAKVTLRNARRDANKHADQLEKDTEAHVSKDQVADLKDTIQEILKKHETTVEDAVKAKSAEVMEV